MSTLEIRNLRAGLPGSDHDILRSIDLTIRSGEVHAVMGPNGSGKSTLSHVLMGKPEYEVRGGTVTLDGVDLLALPTHERAQAGLFLAMQYPTEIPGVRLDELLGEALVAAGRAASPADLTDTIAGQAERIGFDDRFLDRFVNVVLSGGEKKRNETLQLSVLRPRFAILDELDSGLDVDALRAVSRRIEAETNEAGLGVLAITHYKRLLEELRPDVVQVLSRGRIVATGGPDLAEELERTGYAAYADEEAEAQRKADEAAKPTIERPEGFDDPFGDPLADL
jgi:Fe-S cluster assembly ATP-binding protein